MFSKTNEVKLSEEFEYVKIKTKKCYPKRVQGKKKGFQKIEIEKSKNYQRNFNLPKSYYSRLIAENLPFLLTIYSMGVGGCWKKISPF